MINDRVGVVRAKGYRKGYRYRRIIYLVGNEKYVTSVVQ